MLASMRRKDVSFTRRKHYRALRPSHMLGMSGRAASAATWGFLKSCHHGLKSGSHLIKMDCMIASGSRVVTEACQRLVAVRPYLTMQLSLSWALQGLVKAVGVSNYGPRQLERIHAYLERRGIPLASAQACCTQGFFRFMFRFRFFIPLKTPASPCLCSACCHVYCQWNGAALPCHPVSAWFQCI